VDLPPCVDTLAIALAAGILSMMFIWSTNLRDEVTVSILTRVNLNLLLLSTLHGLTGGYIYVLTLLVTRTPLD